MKSTEIRQRFLDYFARHGHEIVASSPLVPGNDPTLLFTNAGMVQFKEVFLGEDERSYQRATSSQRCLRAGGKHNDLENVGYTARHHTFFEMLGNFSFGDYFKRDAIRFAWGFLTEDLGIAPERLWVTVYKDDDEAADIWLKEMNIDPARFSRLGEKDNFWTMGDTGPCGPCSEIFYDHGPKVAGGPPGSPDEDGDRYVEIWNLVFMQFNRDASGKDTPLPKPSVDTGMGLERMSAVMQGVTSNYDIDIFQGLINAAAKILGVKNKSEASLKVIADHIRAAAFLITDGVFPANEGRGYVLRRIMRRALRHGHSLGAREHFFHRLVAPLVKEMGEAYPELAKAQSQVETVIHQEEERFAETLDKGLKILDEDTAKLNKGGTIAGATVFQLYDTYGFPVDLTADIARERGLKLDMEGFEREMSAQRERARAASGFKSATVVNLDKARESNTSFTGYGATEDSACVTAILVDGKEVQEMQSGTVGVVYLDQTPFYAESGGQVGDTGTLEAEGFVFRVKDTQKGYAHIGALETGVLTVGARVRGEVDATKRAATAANHSATHLMHAALREVLGVHVQQKGSLVDGERLRFDFSHFEAVTPLEIAEIERLVNSEIRANRTVETRLMPIKEAMNSGAMALFGEKYADEVRVVGMGEFSVELCGGTHVARTGDIGLFKIVSEGGVAAGVRRIEAVTAEGALGYFRKSEETLADIAGLVKGGREDVVAKVEQLIERERGLHKELEQLKARLASSQGDSIMDSVQDIDGVKLLAARLDGVEPKALRDTMDRMKDKLGSAVVVLAAADGDKVSLVAGVTKDLTGRFHAGKLVGFVAEQLGGKGGGRPDMAQAGAKDASKLDAALDSVASWIGAQ